MSGNESVDPVGQLAFRQTCADFCEQFQGRRQRNGFSLCQSQCVIALGAKLLGDPANVLDGENLRALQSWARRLFGHDPALEWEYWVWGKLFAVPQQALLAPKRRSPSAWSADRRSADVRPLLVPTHHARDGLRRRHHIRLFRPRRSTQIADPRPRLAWRRLQRRRADD